MTQLDPAIANLTTPAVLAFLVGIFAATIRSDLHVPRDIVSGLSMYLLISIGLKGGAGLADSPLGEVWLPIVATVAVGVITPVGGYVLLRRRFDRTDAAAIAAHYGSTSVVTFAAALMFLDAAGISYEPFVPVLVAVLEVPAIVVALGIASWTAGNGSVARRCGRRWPAARCCSWWGGSSWGWCPGRTASRWWHPSSSPRSTAYSCSSCSRWAWWRGSGWPISGRPACSWRCSR